MTKNLAEKKKTGSSPGKEDKVEPSVKRRSDRVSMEFPLEVVGTDATCFNFFDKTRTVLISRHGAMIALARVLSPEQEVTVLCPLTGKEAAARVVGRVEGQSGEHYYGIAFLDPAINLWDIEFAELSESEKAAARVLLECGGCHTRRVTYLDVPETEVLDANQRLSIFCDRCSNATTWFPAPASAARQQLDSEQEANHPASPLPQEASDKRKEKRLRMQVAACVRDVQLGQEVTQTVDISKGGVCFRSRKRYQVGALIQAAFPYTPNQANIFVPGRIVYSKDTAEAGVFFYGVAIVQGLRQRTS